MPPLDDSYPALIAALTDRYGRPDVPGPSGEPFEDIVGAYLTQATSTTRGSDALEALREAGLLQPGALADADPAEIGQALRTARVNARPPILATLKRLAGWVVEQAQADDGPIGLDLDQRSTEDLREGLRALRGIGPGSADAILLQGLGRPTYPVDRASYRILVRHGWLDATAEYDEARGLLERLAPENPQELARLSAWLQQIGHDYCRASVPRCEGCPLQPWLPEGGPCEPDVG